MLPIGTPVSAQEASPIDIEMDRNPVLAYAKIEHVFPRGAARLWVEALDRPDVETKVAAAQSIALARRKGLTGLEGAVTPLARELNRADQHPAVVLAAAQALVALDAKQTADSLLRVLEHGDADLREIIEPALAKWDYAPARAIWMKRLSDTSSHGRGELLAIEALATVKEAKAIPALASGAGSRHACAHPHRRGPRGGRAADFATRTRCVGTSGRCHPKGRDRPAHRRDFYSVGTEGTRPPNSW